MKCPKDCATLTLNEHEGPVGYTCSACEGVWLPENFLRRLALLNDRFNYPSLTQALRNTDYACTGCPCPSCTATLKATDIGDTELDWCTVCGGIWFDQHELEILTRQTPKRSNALPVVCSEALAFIAFLLS